MKLTDFVVTEAILADIEATNKEDVIREIVDALIDAQKINPGDADDIMAALIKREEMGSTGIGKGVAVPHTKHQSVATLVGTVARSIKGIDFDSLDGEPVYIFFLLLSPNNQSSIHLAALERISTVIRNNDFCRFMKDAPGKEEMIEIINDMDDLQT